MIGVNKMCDVYKLKKLLSFKFEMKNLDVIKKILGIEIFKDMKENKFIIEDL